ncbi:hypothetical protein CBR_g30505 [Chara braunii]|uniref:Uncharacterized protein n=1 Tax=Chara braunii TaxID=69332 RepID=A0A388LCU4_CHABU|nr:hypothetical protein CBR_g30505 [Chara braunii]|eukprot:GBG80137.1 hypothetical protein CBR_g30505 [Chara braunii]
MMLSMMMGRTRYLVSVMMLVAVLYGLQVKHVCATHKPPRRLLTARERILAQSDEDGGTSAWWDVARRRVLHVAANAQESDEEGRGSCSSEVSPCTLTRALNLATSGCTIQLGAGTFHTSGIVFPVNLAGTRLIGKGINQTRIVYTDGEEELDVEDRERRRGGGGRSQAAVILDIHAPSMEIEDMKVVLDIAESFRPTSGSGQAIAILLRNTADDVHIQRVSVERTMSGSSAVIGSRVPLLDGGISTTGILIHGAQECSIDWSYIMGPFKDGIVVMTYNTRVRGSVVDGAQRIGIAIIHEKPGAISVVNKIKSNIVQNLGLHGTAIEVQGNGTDVKGNTLHDWGKFGIVVCGPPGGKSGCGKCHYTREMKSLQESDYAFVVSGAYVKENTFSGNGVNEICDNGILSRVEGIDRPGDRSAWPMPVMTERWLAHVMPEDFGAECANDTGPNTFQLQFQDDEQRLKLMEELHEVGKNAELAFLENAEARAQQQEQIRDKEDMSKEMEEGEGDNMDCEEGRKGGTVGGSFSTKRKGESRGEEGANTQEGESQQGKKRQKTQPGEGATTGEEEGEGRTSRDSSETSGKEREAESGSHDSTSKGARVGEEGTGSADKKEDQGVSSPDTESEASSEEDEEERGEEQEDSDVEDWTKERWAKEVEQLEWGRTIECEIRLAHYKHLRNLQQATQAGEDITSENRFELLRREGEFNEFYASQYARKSRTVRNEIHIQQEEYERIFHWPKSYHSKERKRDGKKRKAQAVEEQSCTVEGRNDPMDGDAMEDEQGKGEREEEEVQDLRRQTAILMVQVNLLKDENRELEDDTVNVQKIATDGRGPGEQGQMAKSSGGRLETTSSRLGWQGGGLLGRGTILSGGRSGTTPFQEEFWNSKAWYQGAVLSIQTLTETVRLSSPCSGSTAEGNRIQAGNAGKQGK